MRILLICSIKVLSSESLEGLRRLTLPPNTFKILKSCPFSHGVNNAKILGLTPFLVLKRESYSILLP